MGVPRKRNFNICNCWHGEVFCREMFIVACCNNQRQSCKVFQHGNDTLLGLRRLANERVLTAVSQNITCNYKWIRNTPCHFLINKKLWALANCCRIQRIKLFRMLIHWNFQTVTVTSPHQAASCRWLFSSHLKVRIRMTLYIGFFFLDGKDAQKTIPLWALLTDAQHM